MRRAACRLGIALVSVLALSACERTLKNMYVLLSKSLKPDVLYGNLSLESVLDVFRKNMHWTCPGKSFAICG